MTSAKRMANRIIFAMNHKDNFLTMSLFKAVLTCEIKNSACYCTSNCYIKL